MANKGLDGHAAVDERRKVSRFIPATLIGRARTLDEVARHFGFAIRFDKGDSVATEPERAEGHMLVDERWNVVTLLFEGMVGRGSKLGVSLPDVDGGGLIAADEEHCEAKSLLLGVKIGRGSKLGVAALFGSWMIDDEGDVSRVVVSIVVLLLGLSTDTALDIDVESPGWYFRKFNLRTSTSSFLIWSFMDFHCPSTSACILSISPFAVSRSFIPLLIMASTRSMDDP